jgi:hypothetical protein
MAAFAWGLVVTHADHDRLISERFDLATLVRRLITRMHAARKGQGAPSGDDELAEAAMDYLRRKGLTSPLRGSGMPQRRRRWSAEDDETIRQMAETHRATDIAIKLRRTFEQTVRHARDELGIKLR